MTPVLELDNVTFRREGKQIIDGISLTVHEGEHWALLGPNGAGKSTLLGFCGAVTFPTSGTVRVLGAQMGRTDLARLRHGIGHVNPRHRLHSALSVREGGARRAVEARGGVGHRLVEEFGEQLVGQVIVLGDVAAGLMPAVVLGTRLAGQRDWAHALQCPRNQIGHRGREHGQDLGQVIGGPLAGHVGLPEPDQTASADPAGQPLGVQDP